MILITSPLYTNNNEEILTSTGEVLLASIPPVFIYDRTQEDVDRVKTLNSKLQFQTITQEEFLEWKTVLKGALNKEDLQRLCIIMDHISAELHISIVSLTVPEIPNTSWYSTFLNNIQTLLDNFSKHSETPSLPSLSLNTYTKWNIIEKILWDICDIYNNRNVYYAGNNELLSNNNILI